MVTFAQTRVVLLGAVGTGSIFYVLVTRTLASNVTALPAGLVWPLLGVVPLLGLGLWLSSVSSNRQGLYLLVSGTAMAVGSAVETVLVTNATLPASASFLWVNGLSVTADAVATAGITMTIGAFPDGKLQRPWQRSALRLVWLQLLAFPVSLVVSPTVPTSPWFAVDTTVPNPYAVQSLSWSAPLVVALLLQPWASAGLALIVFASRALFGDPGTRSRLRFMTVTVAGVALAFALWVAGQRAGLAAEGVPMRTIQALVYVAMLALPVAFIHGLVWHGAFGVATQERARVAIRSSWLLITVLYAVAVAAPAVLFLSLMGPLGAVVVTVLLALVLQPLRGLAEGVVRRHVLGDRDRQLTVLTNLGYQLEQTVGLDSVLDKLADAIREGLDATWARIRLLDDEGNWSTAPEGIAGTAAGDPVASRELSRAGQLLGRIDVGPRHLGAYAPHELALLSTIARQASTAVANVRLTAMLGEQLSELTASRVRLVAAQDDERRRIERDLHDGIQQNVVALIAGLRLARNQLARGDLAPGELVELQNQARETLADLREIAHGIHPPVLTDSGLVAAVESRVARFPIPLTVDADEGVRSERFPPEIEATAYYLVREALTNTAKHSSATSARVGLSRDESRLRIEVEDDGRGFNTTTRIAGGGLTNIQDRVAAVRGHLVVAKGQVSGTLVAAELPVAAASVSHG